MVAADDVATLGVRVVDFALVLGKVERLGLLVTLPLVWLVCLLAWNVRVGLDLKGPRALASSLLFRWVMVRIVVIQN